MRHVLGITGVMAAAVLLLVSAAMNWQFGYNLGRSEFESHLYGVASAAADCFKALLPFFIVAALRNRTYSQALGGIALFVLCFTYSLTNSLGFGALNRADTAGSRVLQAQTHQDLRAELDRSRSTLKSLPEHRPAGTVAGEIEAVKQNPRWTTTKGCTDATIPESRVYCEGYFKLQAEHAAAAQAAKLDARIIEIRQQLGRLGSGAAAKAADPQSQVLSRLSGRSQDEVDTALTVLIALLVELGSSLGFYIAFAYWRIFDVKGAAPEVQPQVQTSFHRTQTALRIVAAPAMEAKEPVLLPAEPKTDVELYFDERVGRDESSSVTALALYDDYCQWCEARQKQPLGLPIFTRRFSDLGIQKAKVAGRIRYLGVRLLFNEDEDGARELSAVS
jgi:hypothetical protein